MGGTLTRMSKEIEAVLANAGFQMLGARQIGKGGQLTTCLADVADGGPGEARKVIVKTTDPKSKLVEAMGFPQSASVKSEGVVGDLLAKGNLGPQVLYATEKCVVRAYSSGKSLDHMLRTSDCSQRQKLIRNALDFLLRLIDYLIDHKRLVYLDSHSRNLIVDGNDIVLIDHEWAFWSYKDKTEFSAVTLVRFIADLAAKHGVPFSDLFEQLEKCSVCPEVLEKCQIFLAYKYLTSNSITYSSLCMKSKELTKLLAGMERFGTAKKAIDNLCVKLRSRSLRYCFARRYDNLWSQGIYSGKDIDIFLHPEDYPEFILLAVELGFSPYKSRCLAYYCDEDEIVLFIDLHMRTAGFSHKAFKIEEILAGAEMREGKKFIAAEHLVIQLIVNNLLRGRKFTQQYQKDLEDALAKEDVLQAEIMSATASVFGNRRASTISELVLRKDWEGLSSIGRIKCVDASANPEMSWNANFLSKLFELMHRGPKIVALLGVDGAGKSSTLRRVRSALSSASFGSGAVYLGCYYPPSGRGQSFVLPTDKLMSTAFKALGFFRARGMFKRKIVFANGQGPDEGIGEISRSIDRVWKVPLGEGGECDAFVFRLYAWVLVLDALLMGMLLRLRGTAEASHFLFTDRYFYDLITFLGKDHPGAGLLSRMNEPEVAIFLYARPEVQVVREPRHSVSEITTNQDLYRTVKVRNPRLKWVEVSTEIPVGLVVQKVIAVCMQSQRKKSFIKFIRNSTLWLFRKIRFI